MLKIGIVQFGYETNTFLTGQAQLSDLGSGHWLPGEGDIPWSELYKALLDVGYTGAWMYEIGPKCPNTILRDRDLTCADFARNAKEIFEGKPLTVFSQRIELNG